MIETPLNRRPWAAYILKGLFVATAGFIVAITLLKSQFTHVLQHYYPLDTLLPHPVLMFCGIILTFAIYLACTTTAQRINRLRQGRLCSERSVMLAAGLFFFLLQLLLIYNYYFETDWDVQVLIDTARQVADGNYNGEYYWYYSTYPNNVFLTQLFAVILWLAKPLHLGSHDFLSIVVVQSVACTVTGWMLYQLARHCWKQRGGAAAAYIIYLLLIGLSPWTSIPYSDASALIFPTAMLWIYACLPFNRHPAAKWLLITTIGYIGFRIKPQVIFACISILAIDLYVCWRERDSLSVFAATLGRRLLMGFVGLMLSVAAVTIFTHAGPIKYKASKRLGAPHYLMMGLNRNSIGDYNDADVVFARSFPSIKERNKGELREAHRRVKEMTAGEFAHFMCEKTLVNYYDGTFFWGKEGYFYKTIYPEKNKHLSPFLRNLYYNRMIPGKYFPYWCSFATALWLGMLALMFVGGFGRGSRYTYAVIIAILMLTLYECLFESRARYFYIYVPFYILMAMEGLDWISEKCKHLRDKPFWAFTK